MILSVAWTSPIYTSICIYMHIHMLYFHVKELIDGIQLRMLLFYKGAEHHIPYAHIHTYNRCMRFMYKHMCDIYRVCIKYSIYVPIYTYERHTGKSKWKFNNKIQAQNDRGYRYIYDVCVYIHGFINTYIYIFKYPFIVEGS